MTGDDTPGSGSERCDRCGGKLESHRSGSSWCQSCMSKAMREEASLL